MRKFEHSARHSNVCGNHDGSACPLQMKVESDDYGMRKRLNDDDQERDDQKNIKMLETM